MIRKAVIRAIALVALLAVGFSAVPVAQAQQPHPPHKKSFIQRHPTLTGVAAGVATHHMLKKSAAQKKAHGQKLNWAERHPTLSGIGVGAATRHVIKKHTR